MKHTTIFLTGCFLSLTLALSQSIKAVSESVVISEVQIGGTTASDEFVELYNKSDQAVDLSGWRLTRKTASGSESTLATSLTGTVPAYGFYLIAHPDYDGPVTADMTYSAPSNKISANNTLVFYPMPQSL